MNRLLSLSVEPVLIYKFTGLLALAWICHALFRHQHPRWRLHLWRSVLCLSVMLLPIFDLLPDFRFEVPLQNEHLRFLAPVEEIVPRATPSVGSAVPSRTSKASVVTPVQPRFSWTLVIELTWLLGACIGTLRLLLLQRNGRKLRAESASADAGMQELADNIRRSLDIQKPVRVGFSHSIPSPLVCGIRKPMIILPSSLSLSTEDLRSVLCHELAHVRHGDLAWSLAWRSLRVICWFHPFVWRIPAAHELAGEQEADRIASRGSVNREHYSELLARLALSVLTNSRPHLGLSWNGAAQIVRRLEHLRQESTIWGFRHSVSGFALAASLLVLSAGWKISSTSAASRIDGSEREFKELEIRVVDEAGRPIAGATIKPDGFRVKQRHADAYGWRVDVFGPSVKVTTDADGKATVRYPMVGIPEEKLTTSDLIFSVHHTNYVAERLQQFPVDGSGNPVRLTRGCVLSVRGLFGGQAVTGLSATVSGEDVRAEDWQEPEAGTLRLAKLSPGEHVLQLSGQLPGGELVFSEGTVFSAERGKPVTLDLKMVRGIRLEGKVDARVTRPVKHGRVLISVRPKEYPAFTVPEDYGTLLKRYGQFTFWKTYRTIHEDGSFVFESIPPGEVDVIVHGEGFASKNGGEPRNRIDGKLVSGLVIGVPQAFKLEAPTTRIEVATEPTGTLSVTARGRAGEPIEGATIFVSPNVMRMQTGIFGAMRRSSEDAYVPQGPFASPVYSATTDAKGVAVLRNVPVVCRSLDVESKSFEIPINRSNRDRYVRFTLAPGETKKLNLTLQPKGREFIGTQP